MAVRLAAMANDRETYFPFATCRALRAYQSVSGSPQRKVRSPESLDRTKLNHRRANDTTSSRAMASDHGEFTRLVRLGPGMSAGVRNLKYVKADWELLAKIEGREFPHSGRIKVRDIRAPLERPPAAALTLETTVTVAADKLRGGLATPRSLMHSGLSKMGRQPKVEMIKIEPIGMGSDVPTLTNDPNQHISRIGGPRLGSLLDGRLLTPRELQALAQASVTPRGYTASSLRRTPQGSHSARDASTRDVGRSGLLLPLGMLDGAENWKIRSLSSSVSHRAGSDVPRTCAVHGATLRVMPGKADYVLLARRRADYVGEQERIPLPVVGEGGWKVPVSARVGGGKEPRDGVECAMRF